MCLPELLVSGGQSQVAREGDGGHQGAKRLKGDDSGMSLVPGKGCWGIPLGINLQRGPKLGIKVGIYVGSTGSAFAAIPNLRKVALIRRLGYLGLLSCLWQLGIR